MVTKLSTYKNNYQTPFGHNIFADSLGNAWLGLVDTILNQNTESLDEGRKRLDIQNVRIRSNTQIVPDKVILKYANRKNLDLLFNLTFKELKMVDTDIVPSFPPGADSYYKRIVDGNMINFVIKRLTTFPESKKAVMVFPNTNDYKAVLAAPKDDYLPCIVSIQFRLVDFEENETSRTPIEGYILKTIFTARSIDAFQKACGNFWAIAQLSQTVAEALEENLKTKVQIGPMDGLITDAHIYNECVNEAKTVIEKWKNRQ